MARVRDHVRFHSPLFTPAGPEEGQINPGCFGRTLAVWLRERLTAVSVEVGEPVAEDWGWLLGATVQASHFGIGCANVDDSDSDWLVFVETVGPGILAKLFQRTPPNTDSAAALARQIDAILRAEPDITRLEWFQVDRRTGREAPLT
jgi:hypothetical protein